MESLLLAEPIDGSMNELRERRERHGNSNILILYLFLRSLPSHLSGVIWLKFLQEFQVGSHCF